jgi:hypothetical protein
MSSTRVNCSEPKSSSVTAWTDQGSRSGPCLLASWSKDWRIRGTDSASRMLGSSFSRTPMSRFVVQSVPARIGSTNPGSATNRYSLSGVNFTP